MRTTLDLPKDLIDEAMKATHINGEMGSGLELSVFRKSLYCTTLIFLETMGELRLISP